MRFKTFRTDSMVCNQWNRRGKWHNRQRYFQNDWVQFPEFKRARNRFDFPNIKFSDRNQRYCYRDNWEVI
jgi:hypothetical protein